MNKIIAVLIGVLIVLGCSAPEPSNIEKYEERLVSEMGEQSLLTYLILDKSISVGQDSTSACADIIKKMLWPRLSKKNDIVVVGTASENALNPNNRVVKKIRTTVPDFQGLDDLEKKKAIAKYFNALISEKKVTLQAINDDFISLEANEKQTELVENLVHLHTILKRYPEHNVHVIAITDARQVSERFYLDAKSFEESKKLASKHVADLKRDYGVSEIFGQIERVQFLLPQDSLMAKNELGNFADVYWQSLFEGLGYNNEVSLETRDY